MAAFFVGKTGAAAEYVMIYEYRYFVYLDNSQKYLDFLAEKALYPCRFQLVGKGLERETLCPLPRLRRFGTHIETGSKFLLLFSIKSKEERPCFAKRVPNWRTTYLHQEKLGMTAPIKKRSLSTPFLYLFLYTSKENLTPFSSCISPFSSKSQSGFSSRFGKAVSAG